MATLAAIAVVALGMTMAAKPAWNKMWHEWAAVQEFFDGNDDEPLISSATIRLYLWTHSLEIIVDRPLTGYGGKSGTPLIKSSDLPEKVRNFGHVHNSYLALCISYGVIAPLVLLTVLVGLVIRAANACRNTFLPRDVVMLFLVWMTFLGVVNLFELHVHYDSGVFLMMALGGIAYSTTLPYRRSGRDNRCGSTSTPESV